MSNYAIKVSIINEDGDEEFFETVPSLSVEQGQDAVARLVRKVENINRNIIPDDE
jgi:hypothetical protein